MIKNLETVGRVTHTQAFLDNEIARNSKTFNIPKNIKKKSKIDCIL